MENARNTEVLYDKTKGEVEMLKKQLSFADIENERITRLNNEKEGIINQLQAVSQNGSSKEQ